MSEKELGQLPAELLVSAVGAVIYAAGEPVHPEEIASAFRGTDVDAIEEAVHALQERFDKSEAGLCVERIAGGFRMATRPEVGAWVRQFFRHRNRTRLSPAALETLAIVAYRQPVTAPEIQAIRARDPSAALRNLLDKKLLRILGKKKVVGNPLLYGTSKQFLVHFGLNSLEDLPSIEEFDEFVGALRQSELFTEARKPEEPGRESEPADPLDGSDPEAEDPAAGLPQDGDDG